MIGNKSDLVGERQVTTEQGKALARWVIQVFIIIIIIINYCNILCSRFGTLFVETSAINSVNVKEALIKLATSIRARKLTPEERERLFKEIPKWNVVQGRDAIHRAFTFPNFSTAFGFMTHVALVAEKVRY